MLDPEVDFGQFLHGAQIVRARHEEMAVRSYDTARRARLARRTLFRSDKPRMRTGERESERGDGSRPPSPTVLNASNVEHRRTAGQINKMRLPYAFLGRQRHVRGRGDAYLQSGGNLPASVGMQRLGPGSAWSDSPLHAH